MDRGVHREVTLPIMLNYAVCRCPQAKERMREILSGRFGSTRHELFRSRKQRDEINGRNTSKLHQVSYERPTDGQKVHMEVSLPISLVVCFIPSCPMHVYCLFSCSSNYRCILFRLRTPASLGTREMKIIRSLAGWKRPSLR